ncbi:Tetrahedral aminopeptidase [Candidatus Anstonella stagnisolia]|nr:Tetrahedral aminopeptidase [Candidatus Anstonella stagnisolia]
MVDIKLLARLSNAFGIPSQEGEIREIMMGEFRKIGYDAHVDRFGNVVAKEKKVKEGALMLGAHMDEIGLMVKFINDKGFIRFIKVGGIDNRVLLNQRVVVRTAKGKIYGVIGHKPPHMQKREEAKESIDNKQLFIDIGAASRKDAEAMGVAVGDPICFDMELKTLNGKLVTGKALDNRVGCYVLLEAAKKLRGKNIVFVGTAQEEVSTFGKGAALSAYHHLPAAFVAIDTAIAGDHPEMSEDDSIVHLGKGPALTLVEAGGMGNIADEKLRARIMEVAKKAKIALQIEVIEGGATDAASVYNVRGGIPSIAVGVPARYIHSNVSVCSLKDIDKTIEFVVKVGSAKLD